MCSAAAVVSGLCFWASAIAADGLDAIAGRALFERAWVPAPSSTDSSDGLGPLFNARSCATCHTGGRGARIVIDANGTSRIAGAVVRLGDGNGVTDPFYGLQLQTDAVPGLTPEARVSFMPKPRVEQLGPPLAPGISKSTRLAPSLLGRSAFATISDAEIHSRADPDDANGDGISGRANQTAQGIGRFGWKSAHATLEGQIAHAFAIDMGLSSPAAALPFGDCTPVETQCMAAATGESALNDNREISSAMLTLVAAYLDTLPAAVRRDDAKANVLFEQVGCAQCHVPTLTAPDGSKITAFTDLLLHDLGQELDDGVGEPGVKSSEWRTAPLIISYARGAKRLYLHDGSASSVAQAVAKHGGEAAGSRDAFTALTDYDKKKLTAYLENLK
ncbi:MAG: di-heme oxidoredictase family protein [Hyphomicrobium sp.]